LEKIKGANFKSEFWLSVFKGALLSLVIAMVLILIFAFIVKWTSLSEGIINPINQIIKVICIFFGVVLAMKKNTSKFWLRGIAVGAIFSILSFVLFSMMNDFNFTFEISNLWDLLFTTLLGLLCSIIVYFLKK